jgi:hypothetical protein
VSTVKLTVDGVVEFNGQLGSWVSRPPEFIRKHLEPGAASPDTWVKAVMLSISDSVLLEADIDIDVRTRPTGWSLDMDRK